MISAVTLKDRIRDIRANDWILDSGAFSQISRHGKFVITADEYLRLIERWSRCGNMLAACTQDWMCEPFILEKTGLSIAQHHERTVLSYEYLSQRSQTYVMPVLQGFEPKDYVHHLYEYGLLIQPNAWVGVGSVCKRNGNSDAIEDILLAIKAHRPDLKLHGFGLKIQALESGTVRSLLHSSDSMAWSYAGRRNMNPNDPREALRYAAKVQALNSDVCFIQDQLFHWWHEQKV